MFESVVRAASRSQTGDSGDQSVTTTSLMSRKRRKTSKDEFEQVYRKCRYCKAHRDTRLFDRHVIACKARWIIQNENRQLLSQITTTAETTSIQPQVQLPEGFMEGSSGMQLEDTIMEAEDLDTFRTSSAPVLSLSE